MRLDGGEKGIPEVLTILKICKPFSLMISFVVGIMQLNPCTVLSKTGFRLNLQWSF